MGRLAEVQIFLISQFKLIDLIRFKAFIYSRNILKSSVTTDFITSIFRKNWSCSIVFDNIH